jgi:hypothetical protein
MTPFAAPTMSHPARRNTLPAAGTATFNAQHVNARADRRQRDLGEHMLNNPDRP